MRRFKSFSVAYLAVLTGLVLGLGTTRVGARNPAISIQWDKVVRESKTKPTLQVVVNPLLKRGSPIHTASFQALRHLQADKVRFVSWFAYPHMSVVELKPPTSDSTYWGFSQVDSIVEDFMEATEGPSVMMNFSTIPVWMFKTEKPVEVPSGPDQVCWGCNQGTELRDSTLQLVTDYFVRLWDGA